MKKTTKMLAILLAAMTAAVLDAEGSGINDHTDRRENGNNGCSGKKRETETAQERS